MKIETCRVDQLDAMPNSGEFTYKEISILASLMEHRWYKKGELVFEEGTPANFFATILEGRLEITREGRHIFPEPEDNIIGEKRAIGFDALDPYPRNLTLRAIENVELLSLTNKQRQVLVEKHPRIAVKFYSIMLRLNSLQLRYITGIL